MTLHPDECQALIRALEGRGLQPAGEYRDRLVEKLQKMYREGMRSGGTHGSSPQSRDERISHKQRVNADWNLGNENTPEIRTGAGDDPFAPYGEDR